MDHLLGKIEKTGHVSSFEMVSHNLSSVSESDLSSISSGRRSISSLLYRVHQTKIYAFFMRGTLIISFVLIIKCLFNLDNE